MPIIKTACGAILRSVVREVADGAGLAVVRGAPGIGKSFALDVIAAELEDDGAYVVRVTASPATGGSVSAFLRSVLSQYRIEAGSTLDALEELANLLAGYPFRDSGPKIVFLVDEGQELKVGLPETRRSLWDRGTHARLGIASGPAFGLVMVGNQMFLGKGGNIRQASFLPLMSRVTHNVVLPRPDRAEFADLAAALFPDRPELQAELAEFGGLTANLRSMGGVARQARMIAKGDAVSLPMLKTAQRLVWGKKQ